MQTTVVTRESSEQAKAALVVCTLPIEHLVALASKSGGKNKFYFLFNDFNLCLLIFIYLSQRITCVFCFNYFDN